MVFAQFKTSILLVYKLALIWKIDISNALSHQCSGLSALDLLTEKSF